MCPNNSMNTDSKKLPSLKKSRFTEMLIEENAFCQSDVQRLLWAKFFEDDILYCSVVLGISRQQRHAVNH
jgi:hypothetical protein